MHVFHVRYRNTQGTLMRILNAASRRGIELPLVQAEPAGQAHRVTLLLEINPRQAGQLCREWHSIVDVTEVRSGIPLHDVMETQPAWTAAGHPPMRAEGVSAARTATA